MKFTYLVVLLPVEWSQIYDTESNFLKTRFSTTHAIFISLKIEWSSSRWYTRNMEIMSTY